MLLTMLGIFAYANHAKKSDHELMGFIICYCLLMSFYLIDSILNFALLGCKFIWKSKKEVIFQSILMIYAWVAFFFVVVKADYDDISVKREEILQN